MHSLGTHAVRAFLEEPHHTFADELRKFCEGPLAAHGEAHDDEAARLLARIQTRAMGEAGMLQLTLDPSGGEPRAAWRLVAMAREALGYHSPLADAMFALQYLGGLPIARFGDVDQRQRWLPGICSGELIAGFAMTEAAAGSDVAATATRAVKDGGDYVLDGSKTYISNAGLADVYVIFASTDPEAGRKGLSAFILPADTPGLSWEPQRLAEPHPLGTLTLEGVRLPASARLGAEGAGLKTGLATLEFMRPTVGAAAAGMAARALDESVAHCLATARFGKPIAQHQLVQRHLAEMKLELDASRLLVYRALWEADQGAARITLESATAKCYATEAAQRIIDRGVQLLGGQGVMLGNPVERAYRAVRALRIYEGTTEIQHLVIAGQLLAPWS